MDYINNAYNSLRHYFDTLEWTGSYDMKETMNLLIYCFVVDEIFNGSLYQYLTDEGLAQFMKMFRCIYNGCLINNEEEHIRLSRPKPNYTDVRTRHTELSEIRITEDSKTRTIESGK